MKTHSITQNAIAATLLLIAFAISATDDTVPEGPYLGQKPPGLIPEVFAPGVVSTKGWELNGVFSPDMASFYFLRESGNDNNPRQEFVLFKQKNNKWYEEVVSARKGQAIFSPDGKTLHLGKRYQSWTDKGWSEIKSLGSQFEKFEIMRLTSSLYGTYVFDEIGMPDGDGIIRYSRIIDGKHEAPKAFGKEINSGTWKAHPFIAPDESYLIWDARMEGGLGGSDLYISFKLNNGLWSEAINMGEQINSDAWDAGASVTPDGKYLFFNRNVGSDKYENVDIYWVDAQIIEQLRPKELD